MKKNSDKKQACLLLEKTEVDEVAIRKEGLSSILGGRWKLYTRITSFICLRLRVRTAS